ncbi:MAG: hypothetical protein IT452_05470 [Planctomycetia bacterium]|nr:hypothetical protein [Planctomycetia bacterium]
MRRRLLTLAVASALCGCRPSSRPAPPAPPPQPARVDPDEAAWSALESSVSAMAAAREFGAALRALDHEARIRPALADRASALRSVVLGTARGAFDEEDRRARAAVERGEEDAAIAIWNATLAWDVNELSDAARLGIQDAETSRFRRSHAAGRPRLGPVLRELRVHLLARDDAAAKELLRRVAAETPALRHEMDWLEGTVIEAPGVFGCVTQGLRAMKGDKVVLDGAEAVVAGADSEAAAFDRAAGGPLRVPLAHLPPDLFLAAGLRGGSTADFVGQYLLFTGRIAEARRAFDLMKDRPDLKALADAIEAAVREDGR